MHQQTDATAIRGDGPTLFVPRSTAAKAAGTSDQTITRLALQGLIRVEHRPGRTPRFALEDAKALATSPRA